MAVVEVAAGVCGFVTRIEARPTPDEQVELVFESDCGKIRALSAALQSLDPLLVITTSAKDSPVLAAAARCRLHAACPVPIGVLKAVEVAGGLALPREASIRFDE